jgi:hypothetical protein
MVETGVLAIALSRKLQIDAERSAGRNCQVRPAAPLPREGSRFMTPLPACVPAGAA